ncbi:MAG: hypothetical protein IKV87_08485 [Methanobrevibacter sp.]|nr:hypothetical protein [Methanobrevibacter sp.]
MDSKEIILLVALSFLAIVSIASVSALDSAGGDNLTTATVGGYEFNIPDGWVKNDSYETVNETVSSGGGTFLVNAEGFQKGENDIIYIHVTDYCIENYVVNITKDHVRMMGMGENATINGHEGLLGQKEFSDPSSDLKCYVFYYDRGGDLVTVMATDESLLEQVIPED